MSREHEMRHDGDGNEENGGVGDRGLGGIGFWSLGGRGRMECVVTCREDLRRNTIGQERIKMGELVSKGSAYS